MNKSKNKKEFKFPHTFTILFGLIVILVISTYIIPAGNFERITDAATGIVSIDPNSFKYVDQTPVGFFGIFLSIQKGMVEGAGVIFLIFFAYFWVYTINKTGSLHGAINALLKKLNGKESLIIPIFMVIFAFAGSTYGEWDTIYGLIPIFVGLSIALGYDAIVGLAMSGMAVAVGFASATTNPFTIGIAQSIAGLPIFSGLVLRWAVFVVMVVVSSWWTMRYAKKIKKDPGRSLMKGIDLGEMEIDREEIDDVEFTLKRKFTIFSLFATIAFIVFTSLKLGWYIDEMSAVFLLSGLFVSAIWGIKPNDIINNLLKSSGEVIIGAFVVGISRAILVILRDGNILDTVIYTLYLPLSKLPSWLAAEGMLVFQSLVNFFIPSGSGQASAVMPIMTPLSDMVAVNRQVAVLAYQFGDGYSNLLWPTGIAVIISIAKVPLDRWYKFFLPLYGIMFIVMMVFIYIATMVNYGPF